MSFLCRGIFTKLGKYVNTTPRFSTIVDNQCFDAEKIEPRISLTEAIKSGNFFHKPRQVWIESLKTIPEKKLGISYLHPDVFAAQPRVDIIHENIRWQRMFRFVVRCLLFETIILLCRPALHSHLY